MVMLIVLVALMALPARAEPGPPPRPPKPRPLDLTIAVPRHLRIVSDHLARVLASDDVGRRALTEARTSMSAAQAALGTNALRTADELAASADDLIHVVTGSPRHGPEPDPTQILQRVAVVTSALATIQDHRVRELLEFANDVADDARRRAARSDSDAGREATRADAIARAAAHVAIAADPSLGPILPPPRPKPPPAPEPD